MDETIKTGAEELEIAEPTEIVEGEKEQEVTDPVVEQKEEPKAKTEADTAFAELRRAKEEAERRARENEERSKELEEALGLFFDGENKAEKAIAYFNQKPVEEVIAEKTAEKQNTAIIQENEQLKQELAKIRIEALMQADLKKIQEIDPKINSLETLGDDFINLIGAGVNAVTAYHAVQQQKAAKEIVPPKTPGKVNTGGSPTKDFFTRDEVMAMTPEEEKQHHAIIMKSMVKWK